MKHYVGRPEPALLRRAADRPLPPQAPAGERREDLFQARGAQSHRRAQDQQLHRPDPARDPHGQDAIIAETGAGQHGVATATVAARFGLPCTIFMGAKDVERQKPNVFRMKLLGAEVRAGHLAARRRSRTR